jgi:hypothetical protein
MNYKAHILSVKKDEKKCAIIWISQLFFVCLYSNERDTTNP